MSRRSRKHRKCFECGHQGFGQYCHCCADRATKQQAAEFAVLSRAADRAVKEQAEQAARKAERRAWQDTLINDEIDLSHLPKPIVLKARQILALLAQGTEYWKLGGKRLQPVRHMIRIPVTRRYRLLCRQEESRIVPIEVLSHEDYNPLVRQTKRLFSRLFSRGSGKG